jgi:hypothetical protein
VLLAADADLTDKTQLEFVKGCVQLRLTPRDAFKASDNFKEVRLWYRGKSPAVLSAADSPSERLLPRMSKTWNRSGDVSIVQLINVKVNAEASVDSGLMDASAPSGWQVTDHGFRASVPAKASEKPSSPAPIPVTESAPKGEEVPKK